MDEEKQQENLQGVATPGTAAGIPNPLEQVGNQSVSAEFDSSKSDEGLNSTFDTKSEPMSAEANLPNEAEVNLDSASVGQEASSEGFTVEAEAEPFDLSPETPTATDAQPQTGASFAGEAVDELNQRIDALKAQLEERNSQYMRLAADFENYRKRTQKEKEDQEQQVKGATIKELLSVVDNFERARSQIKPQSDADKTIHNSYQGIYKDFVDRLKKIGVAPMRTEGEPFDPSLHEAVMREETDQYPEGTVVEELRRGYVLGEIVLRHAMVKVATAPEYSPSAEEASQG